MTDISKYIDNVKKYSPAADEVAVAGVVRHCGIALRNKDSSLVSASDPAEVNRVVQGFCKKKLARTEGDDAILASVTSVLTKMKEDKQKSRVTVYYLIAEHYGQLALFHPKMK
jgi:3-dehydroquinate synthetase